MNRCLLGYKCGGRGSSDGSTGKPVKANKQAQGQALVQGCRLHLLQIEQPTYLRMRSLEASN